MSISDGVNYLKNKLKKITDVFKSDIVEGYSILGENPYGNGSIISGITNIKAKNTAERNQNLILQDSINTIDISLNKATNDWKNKTNEYLGTDNKRKNYNIFVNKSIDTDNILTKPENTYCLKKDLDNQPWLQEAAGFNDAYPVPSTPGASNFTSYDNAKNACKLWAADSESNVFAVGKNNDNNYACYIKTNTPYGPNDFSANKIYTVPQVAYTVVTADQAINTNYSRAQLLYDGRLSVYNYTDTNGVLAGPTDVRYVQNMNVPESYGSCNSWFGGGINFTSITADYGQRCNNVSLVPSKVRYISLTPSTTGVIQISGLAVFGAKSGSGGKISELIRNTTVTKTVNASPNTNMNKPITNSITSNVKLNVNQIYNTPVDANNYWLLDLGVDYDISEIWYYNMAKTVAINITKTSGMIISWGTTFNSETNKMTNGSSYTLTANDITKNPKKIITSSTATPSPGSTIPTPNYIPARSFSNILAGAGTSTTGTSTGTTGTTSTTSTGTTSTGTGTV